MSQETEKSAAAVEPTGAEGAAETAQPPAAQPEPSPQAEAPAAPEADRPEAVAEADGDGAAAEGGGAAAQEAQAQEAQAQDAAGGDAAGGDAAGGDAQPQDAEDAEDADADEDGDADAASAEPRRPSDKDIARVRALFTRDPSELSDGETVVEQGAGAAAADAHDADASADGAAGPKDAGASGAADAPFLFARWGRPIAPAVFGVTDESAEILQKGVERAAEAAGLTIAEEDPDFGANLLIFVCEDWRALKATPGLARLIPGLDKLVTILSVTGANQYRIFTFAEDAGVKLAVVLLRIDEELGALPPQALALAQGVQSLLVWSEPAIARDAPVTIGRHGRGLIKRWHQRLIEAAYAAESPLVSRDPALAEALAAAMEAPRPRARGRSRRGGRRRDGTGPSGDKNGDKPEAQSAPPADAPGGGGQDGPSGDQDRPGAE